jgi:F-type H+-transporting ATPase subunit b
MELIPYPVGPLNPKVQDLGYALVLFAFVYVLVARVLPRMNQALEARDDAITGAKDRAGATRARAEDERDKAQALLAEARHDAARIRQQAFEEGTALIAEARAIDTPRAAGALGLDGWNSQVSKSAASDVPDTCSAYFWKSPTDAFPYACSFGHPFRMAKKASSPTSLRSAWTASAPRS